MSPINKHALKRNFSVVLDIYTVCAMIKEEVCRMEFDWDQWNVKKNEIKHGVSMLEAESAFYDIQYCLFEDIKHSQVEKRFLLFALSLERRILIVGFTIRNKKIRIITARTASKKERTIYEEKKKN